MSASLDVVIVQGAGTGGHLVGRRRVDSDYEYLDLSMEENGSVAETRTQLGQDEAAVSPSGDWALYMLSSHGSGSGSPDLPTALRVMGFVGLTNRRSTSLSSESMPEA